MTMARGQWVRHFLSYSVFLRLRQPAGLLSSKRLGRVNSMFVSVTCTCYLFEKLDAGCVRLVVGNFRFRRTDVVCFLVD